MNRPDTVNRRRFLQTLGGAGATLGYSVMVNAEDLVSPELVGVKTSPAPDFERIAPGKPLAARLAHEPNMTLVNLECDFFVAGGGMAGVCAAISAARHGLKVVLVQDRSRLGGNASSEVRMHIVGADHHGNRKGWREGGILEELRCENAAKNPHHAWELWDFLLYDKVVSEPNITLLLDSNLYGAEGENTPITGVAVRSDKTEHLYHIKSRYYADCTGDCRLGLEAGAKYRTGHEGRDAFNEPLAPEQGGPGTLGSSILFTSKDYGKPIPFTPPTWARKVTKEHLKFRGIGSWEYGYWWIEWGGHIDAIRDNERIRFELLSIVMGVWDYIKNSGDKPESANWGMDWVGMIPGKRSSRHLEGPHILTQQDCMGLNPPFADAACIGGWPFDNHPSTGFDDPEIPPYVSVKIAEVYNIPLRSMFSANVDNLFMAGRNISNSHVAFGSTRVMGTCSVEGQAIGTAAALCAENDFLPKDLAADPDKLHNYQQALLRDDQTIKNVKNEDPKDLAQKATLTASSEVAESKAAHVVNGWVRDMPGRWTNRWGGEMGADGAWLDLTWDTPQTISHVQLCFDSGFHRQLTLTEAKHARKNQVEGVQPELVKDYRVQYKATPAGEWQSLVEEKDNFLRLRRHDFEAVTASAVRVHVTGVYQGEARIYEVRCYA
ncbi:MAG: FAD-dependent oxidoreductase [Candidatus Hydrogenedentes bacterium]|nr:FAD-dependent oxidoreductase [Candidatus Hydrogenedentota bacterium]